MALAFSMQAEISTTKKNVQKKAFFQYDAPRDTLYPPIIKNISKDILKKR